MNNILVILALKSVCKVTIVQDNEKCSALNRKVQECLGFKLKLIQSQDNPQLWIAKFSFERSEMEANCSVTISYNTEDESFACMYCIINDDSLFDWNIFCSNIQILIRFQCVT